MTKSQPPQLIKKQNTSLGKAIFILFSAGLILATIIMFVEIHHKGRGLATTFDLILGTVFCGVMLTALYFGLIFFETRHRKQDPYRFARFQYRTVDAHTDSFKNLRQALITGGFTETTDPTQNNFATFERLFNVRLSYSYGKIKNKS